MHKFVKSSVAALTAGLLFTSLTASAVNNKPVDKNDPIVKCQEECKVNKDNDSYEACMLKCKKKDKKSEEEESKSHK